MANNAYSMVSVIIPVYQVSDYIERCIRSVISQSYTCLECIIVDDATQDDSIEKYERLISDYCGSIRFRILHHEENRGISAARNTGAKAATGEWLYFMDSDDEITPDCLEKLVALGKEHPDAEMILGNTQKHFEDGRKISFIRPVIPTVFLTNEGVFTTYQQRKMKAHAWNILIKRSFLEEHQLYFKEGIIYEDRLWMFYVVQVLSKLYLCKDITYHYYQRPNSIVTGSKKSSIGKSYSIIYDEILHHLKPGGEIAELNYYVERFCRHYLEHKATIPRYKALMKEYRRCARKYGNWSVRMKLGLTCVMGVFPGGLKVLQFLRKLKN